MTKFEVIRTVTGVKEFANLMFELSKKVNSAEGLAEELSMEIPEEGLQIINSIAQTGNYPLSWERIQ